MSDSPKGMAMLANLFCRSPPSTIAHQSEQIRYRRFSGAWYFLEEHKEPQDGVLVVMSKDRFPTVVAFLREAFGQPAIGPEDIGSGWRYGEYQFTGQDGARIEFDYGAERTQVSIIGPWKK